MIYKILIQIIKKTCLCNSSGGNFKWSDVVSMNIINTMTALIKMVWWIGGIILLARQVMWLINLMNEAELWTHYYYDSTIDPENTSI